MILGSIILLKNGETNERKSRTHQRWAAMIGVIARWVVTQPQDKLSQVYGERHVIHSSHSRIGGFIFAALLSEGVDDDDGPDGGLMSPVYNPN